MAARAAAALLGGGADAQKKLRVLERDGEGVEEVVEDLSAFAEPDPWREEITELDGMFMEPVPAGSSPGDAELPSERTVTADLQEAFERQTLDLTTDATAAAAAEAASSTIANLNMNDTLSVAVAPLEWNGKKKESPRSEVRRTLGPYVLVEPLGVSSEAELESGYELAADKEPRACVVKRMVLALERPELRERFLAEGLLGTMLHHPNLVEVYGFGEQDGVPYLARELVAGINLKTLGALAGAGGVPPALVVELLAQAAEGLAYVHAQTDARGMPLNLVHGEISPQTIMVTRDGRVKLTEISVSSLQGRRLVPGSGARQGREGFMAPEQREGVALDARSDLYALGIVALELLKLRAPADMKGPVDDVGAVAARRCALRRDLPRELIAVLLEMVSLAPSERPESASAVADVMRRVRARLGDGVPLSALLAPYFVQSTPFSSDPQAQRAASGASVGWQDGLAPPLTSSGRNPQALLDGLFRPVSAPRSVPPPLPPPTPEDLAPSPPSSSTPAPWIGKSSALPTAPKFSAPPRGTLMGDRPIQATLRTITGTPSQVPDWVETNSSRVSMEAAAETSETRLAEEFPPFPTGGRGSSSVYGLAAEAQTEPLAPKRKTSLAPREASRVSLRAVPSMPAAPSAKDVVRTPTIARLDLNRIEVARPTRPGGFVGWCARNPKVPLAFFGASVLLVAAALYIHLAG